MTKNTISQRNQDVSDYLRQTTISDNPSTSDTNAESPSSAKSPSESARLAQRLASESSWAERYVPSEGTMTPGVSSATETSRGINDFVTPEEAPPTYELATSEAGVRSPSSDTASRAPSFSQAQHHELPASESQSESQDLPLQRRGITPPQRPLLPPGRHYSRHETSNSINGTFTLHDSLDLSTTSGSISISLDVKPGSHPAILKLKSRSGSIRVNDMQCDAVQTYRSSRDSCHSGKLGQASGSSGLLSSLFGWTRRPAEIAPPPMPVSDDPRKQAGQGHHEQQMTGLPVAEPIEEERFFARVIHATIETSSGSVSGHLVLTPTSDTRLTTTSGSINFKMVTSDSESTRRQLSKLEQEDSRNTRLPATKDLSSVLSTNSGSGSQSVTVTTGLSDTSNGDVVSACRAKHYCTGSGSLNVRYPSEWMGLVHASVGGGGSINVRGSGLEYDKRGNGEVYAWRGTDEPDLDRAVELRIDGSGSVGYSC